MLTIESLYSKNSGRNLTINGLRGLLALAVVLYHGYTGMTTSHYLKEIPFAQIEYAGPFAVNIFFIISGYLILQSLIRSGNVRRFILHRVLRIYPVFLVIHLFIFTVGPIIHYEWLTDLTLTQYILHFVSNLFMLPGIFDLPAAQIVAWSLSFEFAFYIIISVFYFGARTTSTLMKFLCLSSAAVASIFLIYKHPVMLYFVVGILLCLYFDRISVRIRYKYQSWFFLNGVIFLLISFLVYDPNNFWSLSLSLIFSFLFFFTVLCEEGALTKLMKSRAFQYLGNISYSLYLWHTVVMFPVKRLIPLFGLEHLNSYVLWVGFTGVSLLISVMVSRVSYRVWEIRFVKAIKSKNR
ncbi:acyltransferase [Paenibacillus sp. MBLB2552]|uniref:Acyltransferase n=1 Tax=Paenibacillus mellifer TaxID=2937794 RepID=A0A9X1Y276_9BACL|nr:acyltransferase [Paenibacillus mellifer]MCK8489223.1 acyltransferase [Paenibacillus mellifer]